MVPMSKKIIPFLGAVLFFITLLGSPDANAGSRSNKKLGVGVGLITEPFPSILGFNLAYNIMDQLRLTAGYGTINASATGFSVDVTSIGLDAKLFLLDWSFAPFVSGGVTTVTGTVSGTGTTSGISIANTGTAASVGFGVDWQTWIGFNFGLEYKTLLSSSLGSTGAPGLYLGWYF